MEENWRLEKERCPYCGKKLEKGVLYTNDGLGLLFLPRLPKFRIFMSLRRLSKTDGCIVLGELYWVRGQETILPSYVCRDCKAIIHFFDETQQQ